MSQHAIQLDYAKRPRWHRRKWLGRAIIVLALISTGIAAWRWGPEKWERAKLLYWQWRCINYTAPADEVVFDRDPKGKSKLLDERNGYRPFIENYFSPPMIAATKPPDCADRWIKRSNWEFEWANRWPQPILFMHERTAPSGHRYLVVVLGGLEWYESWESVGQLKAGVISFEAANWSQRPKPTLDATIEGFVPPPGIPARLRIFAGQIDPEDASHFTIRYEENGQAEIVDGFVDDVGPGTFAGLPYPRTPHVRLLHRRTR